MESVGGMGSTYKRLSFHFSAPFSILRIQPINKYLCYLWKQKFYSPYMPPLYNLNRVSHLLYCCSKHNHSLNLGNLYNHFARYPTFVFYSLPLNKSTLISKVTTIPMLISNNPIAIWGEGKTIFNLFPLTLSNPLKYRWKIE